MHTRRLITLLLGAWLGSLLMLTAGAVTAFQSSGPFLAIPAEAAKTLRGVGEPAAQQLFHYVAGELSRSTLEKFGLVEIALLFALACLLFLQNYSRTATILAAVMLVAALAGYLLLTPQIVVQGRLLDFRSSSVDEARLKNLTLLYGALAGLRLTCAAGIGTVFIRRASMRSSRRRDQINAVNHP